MNPSIVKVALETACAAMDADVEEVATGRAPNTSRCRVLAGMALVRGGNMSIKAAAKAVGVKHHQQLAPSQLRKITPAQVDAVAVQVLKARKSLGLAAPLAPAQDAAQRPQALSRLPPTPPPTPRPLAPLPAALVAEEPDGEGYTLLNRPDGGCCYPLEHSPWGVRQRYCGEPTDSRRPPYCKHHAPLMREPNTKATRKWLENLWRYV